MKCVLTLFAFFFIHIQSIHAQKVLDQNKPSFDQVYQVSKKSYLQQFQNMTQKEFCLAETPFQKCFTLTEFECRSAVKESLSYCSGHLRMPSSINIHAQGPVWGQKLGECIGSDFYRRNQKRLSKTGDCQRRNTWK